MPSSSSWIDRSPSLWFTRMGDTSVREVGMTIHPRESRYGRREFLGRSAAGVVGLSSLSTILAACGGSDDGNFKPPELQLARPDSPVQVRSADR